MSNKVSQQNSALIRLRQLDQDKRRPTRLDNRHIDRINTILNLMQGELGVCLYSGRAIQIHSLSIRTIFGNKRSSYWFRDVLLIRSSDSYMPGTCALTYHVSLDGFSYLAWLLKNREGVFSDMSDDQLVSQLETARVNWFRSKYQLQLQGKQPFKYVKKSHRYWNPIQALPEKMKKRVFRNWHVYDIRSAALSVLRQLVPDVHLPYIDSYVESKVPFLSLIEDKCSADKKQAKKFYTALIFGGVVSLSDRSFCSREMGFDPKQIKSLMASTRLNAFRNDLKNMWAEIKKVGLLNIRPDITTNRRKAMLYFRHEWEILRLVKDFLRSNHATYFLEHDGFRTREPISVPELEAMILRQLDFKLTISYDPPGSN